MRVHDLGEPSPLAAILHAKLDVLRYRRDQSEHGDGESNVGHDGRRIPQTVHLAR